MKRFRLLQIFLFLIIAPIIIFLILSYNTMYKQNHAIPILEYHNVTNDSANTAPWSVTLNDFKDQISYLDQNCNVVPLKTLLNDIHQKKPIPENTLAITFDDGYLSNYSLAYPIMAEHNIPATFFIIVKSIETGMIERSQSMNWSQLKEMSDSGLIDIGSHTYNLHDYKLSSRNGQKEPATLARIGTSNGIETLQEHAQRIETDLSKSRQIIEDKLGTRPVILSWPFGAYDKQVNLIAKQTGFIYMIGPIAYDNPKTNVENIGRVVVYGGMDIEAFKKLVHLQKITYFHAMWLEVERIKDHLLNKAHFMMLNANKPC